MTSVLKAGLAGLALLLLSPTLAPTVASAQPIGQGAGGGGYNPYGQGQPGIGQGAGTGGGYNPYGQPYGQGGGNSGRGGGGYDPYGGGPGYGGGGPKGGNWRLPPGPYRQSCANPFMNGSVLTASCRNGKGKFNIYFLDMRRCGGRSNVFNIDGKLICR